MNSKDIYLYSKAGCPFCSLLKMALDKAEINYTQVDLSDDPTRSDFYEKTGTNTVPQVVLADENHSVTNPSGEFLGGWMDLKDNLHVLE